MYLHEDKELFAALVKEVREHRATMKICPSAQSNVSIPKMVHEFCSNDFYKQDYTDITSYFLDDMIEYEIAISSLLNIIDKGYFD